jgi:hypothetical protein
MTRFRQEARARDVSVSRLIHDTLAIIADDGASAQSDSSLRQPRPELPRVDTVEIDHGVTAAIIDDSPAGGRPRAAAGKATGAVVREA